MELAKIRQKLDQIDQQILSLLAKRKELTLQVAQVKKTSQQPICDRKREQKILTTLSLAGKKLGLKKIEIQKIWHAIFSTSRDCQQAKLNTLQASINSGEDSRLARKSKP